MEDFPEIEVLSWKRPDSVARPLVWHRFETKEKDGKRYKVRIQDLTEDRFNEAWEFMVKYYFPEEPLSA